MVGKFWSCMKSLRELDIVIPPSRKFDPLKVLGACGTQITHLTLRKGPIDFSTVSVILSLASHLLYIQFTLLLQKADMSIDGINPWRSNRLTEMIVNWTNIPLSTEILIDDRFFWSRVRAENFPRLRKCVTISCENGIPSYRSLLPLNWKQEYQDN